MAAIKDYLGPMRPPFLLLTLSCVTLGWAAAVYRGGTVAPLNVVLCFIGGLAAHICVNAFNEYFDFRSGLDARTQRTPFSGGSGTLPARPNLAGYALGLSVATLFITAAIGVYFTVVRGWGLLPLGLLGLIMLVIYTPWLTKSPLLCLLAPGLGFGTCMVMGTDFAVTGSYSIAGFVASLVPFFLVSNLLLLNQFPDVDADTGVGRKHFPIAIGRKSSARIYVAFVILTYLAIIAGVALRVLPPLSLLGLLTVIFGIPASMGALKNADAPKALAPSMGQNVLLNLVTPLLVAVGLFFG